MRTTQYTAFRSTFTSIAGLGLLAFSPAAHAYSDFDGDGDEPPLEETTFLGGPGYMDGPLWITDAPVHVAIHDPAIGDLEFEVTAVEFANIAGSYLLEPTPFGPAILFDTGDPIAPNYLLAFTTVGVTIPLAPSATQDTFVGTLGATSVELGHTTITQDPQVGGGFSPGRHPGGLNAIRIHAPCPNAQFRQFVTVEIKWTGTSEGPGGATVNHTGTGGGQVPMSGNNGQPMETDGSHTYVDSNVAMNQWVAQRGAHSTGHGEYAAKHGADGNSYIQDAPNAPSNPHGVIASIKAANPGVTVTSIDVNMRFTTYILCGGLIVSKSKWGYTETIEIPNNLDPNGAGPNGEFNGPGIGPALKPFTAGGFGTVEATNQMEPHHQGAWNTYAVNGPNGAANGGAAY